MQKITSSKKLVECAMLMAMAFVLSFIKVIDMPYGGSVTAASMLPIIVAGYRNGTKWGLITGFGYSLLQLLMGASTLAYATTWMAAAAIILLDYIMAFTVLGLVGLLKKSKNQTFVLVLGGLIVCILRYLCHVITGCTVWAGVSIPSSAGVIYSLLYNAAYMVPETIITVYVMALISNSVDLRTQVPITRKKNGNVMAILNAVLVFGIAVVADAIYIFRTIQSENGFDITMVKNADLGILFGSILTGIVLGIAVYWLTKMKTKKKSN